MIILLETMELVALLFCGLQCTIRRSLFALPLAVIGRLCSVFVAPSFNVQGPVAQSIACLTSSLVTNLLHVVAKIFSSTLVFFAAKSEKILIVFDIFQDNNFNITLASNFVKFCTTAPWTSSLLQSIFVGSSIFETF